MGTTKALVLGGGGVVGIAWELGVIAGLADDGLDLTDADLIVGTSAGAAVAAQITTGSLDELVGAQLAESQELAAELDLDLLAEIFSLLSQGSESDDDLRAQVGARALGARTVAEPVRRAVIASRLPSPVWPAHPVLVTAIDAHSGALTRFDASSGVSLIDAVAASCAVPGVWPPVSIGGRRYIDGGVRSVTNADLASGCGR
ncbi:MAG: patatin-like phospholipase family protein, partial [Acidimicrobiales bacterium]